MPQYRTKAEVRMTFTACQSNYPVVIPAGTRCRMIDGGSTQGSFWVDDLRWIDRKADPLLHIDATHRGIVLAPDLVETVEPLKRAE